MALLSSSSFHLLSIQTRETLTNTLPMIYSAVSEERRVRSSIDRSLPHSLSLISLSVHLVGSSLLVIFDHGKRGKRWKYRKTAYRRRRVVSIMRFICTHSPKKNRRLSANVTTACDKYPREIDSRSML